MAAIVQAVRGVSFHLDEGESLGIVGESGSGKSVTCLALLRLLAPPRKVTAETARSLTAPGRPCCANRRRCRRCAAQSPPWSSRTR